MIESEDFLPAEMPEVRKISAVLLTNQEKKLFIMYGKEKGWPVTKVMRVCTKAVILYENKRATTLLEAMVKAELLEVDGRKK